MARIDPFQSITSEEFLQFLDALFIGHPHPIVILHKKIRVKDFFGRIGSMMFQRQLMKIVAARIVEERPGVTVGGANHDVRDGNPGLLTGFQPRLFGDVERNAD